MSELGLSFQVWSERGVSVGCSGRERGEKCYIQRDR